MGWVRGAVGLSSEDEDDEDEENCGASMGPSACWESCDIAQYYDTAMRYANVSEKLNDQLPWDGVPVSQS